MEGDSWVDISKHLQVLCSWWFCDWRIETATVGISVKYTEELPNSEQWGVINIATCYPGSLQNFLSQRLLKIGLAEVSWENKPAACSSGFYLLCIPFPVSQVPSPFFHCLLPPSLPIPSPPPRSLPNPHSPLLLPLSDLCFTCILIPIRIFQEMTWFLRLVYPASSC